MTLLELLEDFRMVIDIMYLVLAAAAAKQV